MIEYKSELEEYHRRLSKMNSNMSRVYSLILGHLLSFLPNYICQRYSCYLISGDSLPGAQIHTHMSTLTVVIAAQIYCIYCLFDHVTLFIVFVMYLNVVSKRVFAIFIIIYHSSAH